MAFDFASFFATHGVPYFTFGKNTKAGWVSIQCPICGPEDPSDHCGCNPETGGWSCWRDRSHKGSSPVYLAQLLLGVERDRAEQLVAEAGFAPPPGEELDRLIAGLGQSPRPGRPQPLRMPGPYRPLEPTGATRHFYAYLKGRGYANLAKMADYYQIRADLVERRLILPLLVPASGVGWDLVGWQARAIGTAALRYVTHPDGAVAKRVLFNHGPAAAGGEVLVVVEGPFDAYKVDWYGRHHAIRAVATLGTSFTDAQVGALYGLARAFDRVLILYDPAAEGPALELAAALAGCGRPVDVGQVPPGVEDAGALPHRLVVPTVRSCLAGL